MVGAVVLAGLSALALLAGVARADDDRPWPGPPACSAVAERVVDTPRGVTLWVQCNFYVNRLSVAANRDVGRVASAPTLHRADAGDALACARRTPRRARCRGDVGQDARIALRMVLRRPVCNGAPLRLRVDTAGGIDCDDGQVCPAIAYFFRVATSPSGC